ncbi:10467_t:CDS:2 [Dentiscutata erythropus]|uniref:10467_t:CDS:1 n=1 Tax=Dentiscutata erythropus TaxID=1348616 RepID=A0A9N9GTG9_9GLOM|nr:10467_t:CDS:2 [Dentiscutata erythropus]
MDSINNINIVSFIKLIGVENNEYMISDTNGTYNVGVEQMRTHNVEYDFHGNRNKKDELS